MKARYQKYILNFKNPSGTSRGVLRTKETWFIIIEKDGEIDWDEGCLSVPNYYDCVKRANQIKVRALNEQGETFELEASELLAVCIQHEIDHLDGILFVDHLSKLKQRRLKEKLKKAKK